MEIGNKSGKGSLVVKEMGKRFLDRDEGGKLKERENYGFSIVKCRAKCQNINYA